MVGFIRGFLNKSVDSREALLMQCVLGRGDMGRTALPWDRTKKRAPQ
jgi:hypothetical protein